MKSKLLCLLVFVTFTNFTFAQLEWKKYDGTVPDNAVIGGRENGGDLAVCRALYKEANHAGKVIGSNCNIGWGGEEIELPDFEVLVNNGATTLSWVTMNGVVPPDVVMAGEQDGKRILVGQADRAEDGSVHPGKIIGENGYFICNYGYGGQEIVVEKGYRILVATPTLEWTPYTGETPTNAVSGGKENGKDLIVCRGDYKGAIHAGKLIGTHCNIGWGGKEIELTSFEILVNGGVPLRWEKFNGRIPKGAVKSGVEKGKQHYVGQATRPDGSIHSGKILGAPGNFIFNYGFGGKEVTVKANFRILVKDVEVPGGK